MPTDPETYLLTHFFGGFGATPSEYKWNDGGTERAIHICPLSVRIEEDLPPVIDKGAVFITYASDGGARLPSLHGDSLMSENFDVIVTAKDNPVLARFKRVFERLVYLQPTPNRLRVAEGPASIYNENIRGFAAEWKVRVKA